MKNILVTGGAGYIGAHACKALSAKGYRPIVFDSLVRGNENMVKYGPLYKGDLLNIEEVREVFTKYDIDAVMHFAAYAYVGESMEQPEMYWQNNVVGSFNLFKVMKEKNVSTVIFSSTCSIYGESTDLITEETPANPLNTYAQTKYVVEKMIHDFARSYGLKSCIFRYFNVAGADPQGEIGELHEPETHIIPLVIQAAMNGHEIKVFGNDYETRDGTCVRDYVHVNDLVEAHIKGLEYLDNKPAGFVDLFNLGTGQGYSVLEIIDEVANVTGSTLSYKVFERRAGDGAFLVSSASKAFHVLDWQLENSDIKTQVVTAHQWFVSIE